VQSKNLPTNGKQTLAKIKASKKFKTLSDLKSFSLSSSKKQKPSFILADISGSMRGPKIEGLKLALKQCFKYTKNCIAFESELWQIDEAEIDTVSAQGGTNMKEALNYAWSSNAGHIILITDGHPTDSSEEEILIAASQPLHRKIPIDTIGISDNTSSYRGYNPDFLKELSRITGGKFTDCGEPLQLTQIVETLLIDYKNSLLNQGAINL